VRWWGPAAGLVLGVAGAPLGYGCRGPEPIPRLAAPALGMACAGARDCGPGLTCKGDWPGGYCLLAHPDGAVRACDPRASACGEGGVCSPLPHANIPGVCLKACDRTDECRPGYRCSPVELFPGEPRSPRGPASACWPLPDEGS
jgi:hypothetical protein